MAEYYHPPPGHPPHSAPVQGHHPQLFHGPPPPYSPPEFEFDGTKRVYTFEDRFIVQRPTYNDVWAGVLFVLTMLGLAAVTAVSIRGYSASVKGPLFTSGERDFGLSSRNSTVLFALVLIVSFVFSGLYFWAARVFTKQIIYATAIMNILIAVVTAFYFFSRRSYAGGIVFSVLAGLYAFCFYKWRSRIPFAVLMLQTVMDIARGYGHVFMVCFLGGLVALVFGAWLLVTLSAVYARYDPTHNKVACRDGSCSKGKLTGLVVFVIFCGYWGTEFIKSAIHMTISGVYGSWYFCSKSAAGMPDRPTMGAFRRTMTYSFGSVSFGSLVVSFIQLLKHAARMTQAENAGQGNMIACAFFCCLNFFLGFVQWLVQYLNHYAYSLIALYGKAYIPAAKDTWRMMKDRGLDALVNDALIDPVLTMGSLMIAYLSTLFAYIYLVVTHPAYNKDNSMTALVLVFAFLAGLQMGNIILNPLKSGVSTLFVAMAWDPSVLTRDHPDLFRRIVAVYPEVTNVVSNV